MSVARENVEKLRGVSAVMIGYTPLKRDAAFWLKETSFAMASDMIGLVTAGEKTAIEAFRASLLEVFNGVGSLPVANADVVSGLGKTFTDLTTYRG